MSIVSLEFLLFFVLSIGIFYVFPSKLRSLWLLIVSYTFYGLQNIKFIPVLFCVTIVSFLTGIFIENTEGKAKKPLLGVSCFIQVGLLAYFKYIGFLTGGRITSIFIPVGISFYILMAVGYLVDVYRGNPACKNIIQYGVFVSFFPIILSGPIERGKNLIPQLSGEFQKNNKFDSLRIRDGFVKILWGLILKAVIADNIATLVGSIYANPAAYGGCVIAIGIILYSFQIYFDFAGYTAMAVGMAMCFGIKVMDNFKQPYLAITIADFWRRWHISLSSWLRDYVYIPLGGNRKGIARKYINVLIVFLVSGIWHGASWTFIMWGALHGIYQIAGAILTPLKVLLRKILKLSEDSLSLKLFRIVVTFGLVSFAWILFQADSVSEVIIICKRLTDPSFRQLYTGVLYSLGLNHLEVWVTFIGIVLAIVVDIFNEHGIIVSKRIAQERVWIRWPVYILAIMIVALCGAWGTGYSSGSFIYSAF